MQKVLVGARILLGLMFFVFGLNGFLNFMPAPDMPPPAQSFMGALMATGYFWPFLKLTETVCGFFLLINRLTPLALTILAPVALNILLFHLFLAPEGLLLPIVIWVLGLTLAWGYRSHYAPLFASGSSVG